MVIFPNYVIGVMPAKVHGYTILPEELIDYYAVADFVYYNSGNNYVKKLDVT